MTTKDSQKAKKPEADESKDSKDSKESKAEAKESKSEAREPKAEAKEPKAEAKAEQSADEPEVRSFFKEILAVARHMNLDRVLLICEESAPFDELQHRSFKKKILVASSSDKIALQCEQLGLQHELIPGYAFERLEKVRVALAGSVSSGKLQNGMQVLCLVGRRGSADPDTCMLTTVGHQSDEQAALSALFSGSGLSSLVLEAVLEISLSLAHDGFEGDPVGSIFVVGDSTAVMEKSRQLTLNPFQGYSEDERNILDPRIRHAIRNFCLLDGATIVREDGVLLAAGRYLRAPDNIELDLPIGLGTRNAAALAISIATSAVSFVISKTTGAVRVYKAGRLHVELNPRRRV